MFNLKTLFVVGAGASHEVGLPIGSQLKSDISQRLNITFPNGWEQESGDREIAQALRKHVSLTGEGADINPYLHAGWIMRDAMPQASSIDNFIEAHEGDGKIELCGKLAITRAILEAESRSNLYIDEHQSNASLDYRRFQDTWYVKLMQLLTEGRRKRDIDKIFKNVSFISFNYDRCIEHFLYHALQTYYSLPPDESAALVNMLPIYHPYGTVGMLPWQDRPGIVPYGGNSHGDDILSLSAQIKTFSERVEDEPSIAEMHRIVQEAEVAVFLGFGFHPQNLELLKPSDASEARHIYATAIGISQNDREVVERQVRSLFQREGPFPYVHLRESFECNSLLDEYRRTLTA